jgi:gas vesicle protein
MHDMYSSEPTRASSSSMMMGFVLGAVVGASLALIMAPATGEETRRRIGDTARRLGREGRHRFDQARETISGLKEDAKHMVDSGREAFNRVRTSETEKPYQTTPNPAARPTP